MDKIIIKFKRAVFVPPTNRLVFGFLYWYDLIYAAGTTENKIIGVYASDVLSMTWQLSFQGDGLDNSEKILLQFAKDTVIKKLKEGTLNDQEELVLLTSTQPQTCPYNPQDVPETKDAEFIIVADEKPLDQEISENKLAASIIEMRDIINAIFHLKHHSKLLLLNEERGLLDFFKTASTEEEFFHRIASLGEVSRNLNVEVLRKITLVTDKKILSVQLLEKLLNQLGKPSDTIIESLKHFGRIRNGYPIHTDIAGVINGLLFFKLKYPVEDYEKSWNTLLQHYLKVLRELYEIFADIYLAKDEQSSR